MRTVILICGLLISEALADNPEPASDKAVAIMSIIFFCVAIMDIVEFIKKVTK